MEVVHGLFVIAFTGLLLIILISKLIDLLDSSSVVSRGEVVGGGQEGNLENKSKVEGFKSVKKLKVEGLNGVRKRVKKVSDETVLVSEFKGQTEPAVVAHDSFDDRKEEFLATEDIEPCSTDQLLSVGKVKDDCFGVDGSVEDECQVSEGMRCTEAVCPVEVSNYGNDLDELNKWDQRMEAREDDVVGEELERCDSIYMEEVGSVGHADQELVNALNPREIYEGTKRTEPDIGDSIDDDKYVVGDRRTEYKEEKLVGEKLQRCDSNHKEDAASFAFGDRDLVNAVVMPRESRKVDDGTEKTEPKIDDKNELNGILESLETELMDVTQGGYVDHVDDQNEESRCLVSKEDVVNRDGDHELVNDVLASEMREVSEELFGKDEGEERIQPKNDDPIDVGLLGGENAVDIDQHKPHGIQEYVETETKDGSQDGHVDHNEAIRSMVSKGETGEEVKGETEISDGEEEWEGIERNELERDFAKALNYFECGNKEGELSKLGSDVIMKFYGLQKVSMEGPCHEPPPMALKLSARAKWNAWQKLGSMIPEEAMEKYISLLSEKVPGWMGEHPSVEGILSSEKDGACSSSDANSSMTLALPLTCIYESKAGEEPVIRADVLTRNSSSVNKDEE